jgi:2,4-dienoyl-CoA reductase-like NADH-dependent reductase (Old Yellow Enzyme family)
MSDQRYPRIASLKTAEAFREHLRQSDIAIEFDETLASGAESPLGAGLERGGLRAGNRFCVLPMEGWDGTAHGAPTDLTRRRWRRFGESGAKLIWGGEAVAVRHDGRANPRQLMLNPTTQPAIGALREELVNAHRERFGASADRDLVVGLQLTHSGRFSRPNEWNRPEPLAAAHHPVLDARVPGGVRVLGDDEIDRLIDDFVAAARLAHASGFQFVDIKQCHGYLGHELLGAGARAGRYGGPLERRFTFVRNLIEAIRASVPGLAIGVRVSAFDSVPYRKTDDGRGVAEATNAPGFALLKNEDMNAALDDSRALLRILRALGVTWICTTAGSPYYCPHLQRPAYFPPADGYQPPEDPLRGVARQIEATSRLKAEFPEMTFVGSAYSYLQDWLPHVAQAAVRRGATDFIGLGRMMLSYPDLPADVLAGRPLHRASICRTFSDCTTGPRLGKVSGCYPLDPFYKARPEAAEILSVRTALGTKFASGNKRTPP